MKVHLLLLKSPQDQKLKNEKVNGVKEEKAVGEEEEEEEVDDDEEEEDESSDPDIEEEIQASIQQATPGQQPELCLLHCC